MTEQTAQQKAEAEAKAKAAADAEAAKAAQADEKAPDPRHDADYFARNVRALIGTVDGVAVSPALVRGALARESRKTHTVEQAKKAVAKHLKEPVELARSLDDDDAQEGEE